MSGRKSLQERVWLVVVAPTISLGSHQNIELHTGARANVVLLTYLLTGLLNWHGSHF